MVNNCANPECAKPLHYLREGRIFVFDMQDSKTAGTGAKGSRRLEHFWLCGPCSIQFQIERDKEAGIRLVPRRPVRMRVVPDSVLEPKTPTALAS
jgi:hypothetical protein